MTIEPITTLPRDLRIASGTLGVQEARYLVDTYYQMQEFRKASANQVRSMVGDEENQEEPHDTLAFFAQQFNKMEAQIQRALDEYSVNDPLGKWARSHRGVGPVIAAGLLANIDISKVKTAGAIWRFAGLDPTSVWNKGERRPWNAALKVLCWKLGDSFVKQSGHPECFYGQLYRQRKAFEEARNDSVLEVTTEALGTFPSANAWFNVEQVVPRVYERGDTEIVFATQETRVHPVQIGEKWFVNGNAAAAAATLGQRNIRDKATLDVYHSGKLPPGRIDLRARRWAVKIFLSHYFDEGWRQLHGTEPPVPYALAELGHTHKIEAPAA